jgi:FixJ family two-component response regulator
MGETGVKIVGVSVDDVGTEEAFMRAGADAFFDKPMKLDVLGSIVQEAINKKNNAMV